jgi:hypothetical protein
MMRRKNKKKKNPHQMLVMQGKRKEQQSMDMDKSPAISETFEAIQNTERPLHVQSQLLIANTLNITPILPDNPQTKHCHHSRDKLNQLSISSCGSAKFEVKEFKNAYEMLH